MSGPGVLELLNHPLIVKMIEGPRISRGLKIGVLSPDSAQNAVAALLRGDDRPYTADRFSASMMPP